MEKIIFILLLKNILVVLIRKLSVNIWFMMLMIGGSLIQCVNFNMKKELKNILDSMK